MKGRIKSLYRQSYAGYSVNEQEIIALRKELLP